MNFFNINFNKYFDRLNTFFAVVVLFALTTAHASGKEVISSLEENPKLLKQLKNLKLHEKICDQYLNRYAVINGIEYYDFDGNLLKNGSIIVQDALAENVVKIFRELKAIKFPVAKMDPLIGKKIVNRLPFGLFGLKKVVDDDDVNNGTTAYDCRKIQYTDTLSLHSFGVAIDINILQNPCIFIDEKKKKIKNVFPKGGVMYLNRKIVRPNKQYGLGKVDNTVVKIFQKYGFDIWGGDWDYPIDYQHFQVSGHKLAELLMLLDKKKAKKLFDKHTKCFNECGRSITDLANDNNIDLKDEYIKDDSLNKSKFFKIVDDICAMGKKK